MAVGRKEAIPGAKSTGNAAVDRYNKFLDQSSSFIILAALCLIWFIAGNRSQNQLILPKFQNVVMSFWQAITTEYYLSNLWITLQRVFKGFAYAFLIGAPLGLIMGYSDKMNRALSPFVNSARQVPVMAWVPLSIVWFGLGDGPTVFMIAFTGVFTVIINTINGVHDVDKSYYNAARSLGASRLALIRDIILPGSFPGVFTGARLALGLGWMSVI